MGIGGDGNPIGRKFQGLGFKLLWSLDEGRKGGNAGNSRTVIKEDMVIRVSCGKLEDNGIYVRIGHRGLGGGGGGEREAPRLHYNKNQPQAR